jgi:hypothetical protein
MQLSPSGSHQLFTCSRISQHFMEPCSQGVLNISLFRAKYIPGEGSLDSHRRENFKSYKYIQVIPPNPIYPRPSSLSAHNYIYVFPVVYFLLASLPIPYIPTYSSSFVLHFNPISFSFICSFYNWPRIHTTKLPIMQFSPPSCRFIFLRSKYSRQKLVLKYVSPLKAMFHNRKETRVKLQFYMFQLLSS